MGINKTLKIRPIPTKCLMKPVKIWWCTDDEICTEMMSVKHWAECLTHSKFRWDPTYLPAGKSWVFTGWTDVETETPILWLPDDSFEKTLMLGKIEDRRRRGDRGWDGWMASPTQWTWVWVNSRSWWWTGRPGMLWFTELQRVGHDWATELNWRHYCPGGGHGNPLQYSCLENPMDRGAWGATVHRVAKSWTGLKRLS